VTDPTQSVALYDGSVEWISSFLHLVFVGFVALFPPVNPIGTALILDPFFRGISLENRRIYSRRIAFYCLGLCTIAMLVGSWIFKLFGISLPVVQLAGGILICRMAWKLLSTGDEVKDSDSSINPSDKEKNIETILFYPLAFPMTTGAGTIAVLLTLSARGHNTNYSKYLTNTLALFVAIVLMCAFVYFCYANTPTLLKRLGRRGEQVVNGLSAFLVFCVGLQIGFDGLLALIR
jgi:multiple antibiotic resistance protein